MPRPLARMNQRRSSPEKSRADRIDGREKGKGGGKEKNRSSPIVEITAIIARVRCFLPVAEEEHHLNHEWFINFTPGSQRSAAALEQSQTRRAQLKFSNFNKVSPARIHRGSRFGSFLDLVLRLIVINRCFSNTRFITMPRVSFHYSSSIKSSIRIKFSRVRFFFKKIFGIILRLRKLLDCVFWKWNEIFT